MKASWKLLGITAIGLFCSSMLAVPPNAANRYQAIPERNMFGLKEQVPVPLTNAPTPAVPKLFLTGITTILGNKLALLSVQFPAKPGQPAREQSLMLTEGQRDEGVEVLTVDENTKEVRVNNWGTEMTLNFDKDGIKTTTAPAQGSAPGQPTSQTPGIVNAAPQANPPGAPAVTLPQTGYRRTLRLPNAAPAPPPPTVPVNPPPSQAAFPGPPAAAQRQATGTSTTLTPEEELLLQALQEKNGGQIAPQ